MSTKKGFYWKIVLWIFDYTFWWWWPPNQIESDRKKTRKLTKTKGLSKCSFQQRSCSREALDNTIVAYKSPWLARKIYPKKLWLLKGLLLYSLGSTTRAERLVILQWPWRTTTPYYYSWRDGQEGTVDEKTSTLHQRLVLCQCQPTKDTKSSASHKEKANRARRTGKICKANSGRED